MFSVCELELNWLYALNLVWLEALPVCITLFLSARMLLCLIIVL